MSQATIFGFIGCKGTPTDSWSPPPIDHDGDGFGVDSDCDDNDASMFPGADELCDGIDNDCDGLVDEDPANGVYLDADGDGWGAGDPVYTCDLKGYSGTNLDCDPEDATAYPHAPETCFDGIDSDCNGADCGYRRAPSVVIGLEATSVDLRANEATLNLALVASTGVYLFAPLGSDATFSKESSAVLASDADLGGATAEFAVDGIAILTPEERSISWFVAPWDGEDDVGSADWALSDPTAFPGAMVAEDLEGDGNVEVIVGRDTGGGQVAAGRALSSVVPSVLFAGDTQQDDFGASLALGDTTGDGVADLLVGAPEASASAGAVYVFEGPLALGNTGTKAEARVVVGGTLGDRLGEATPAVGDIDGDGYGDLILPTPHAMSEGTKVGRVSIISGAQQGIKSVKVATTSFIGTAPAAGESPIGSIVQTGGDVDSDDLMTSGLSVTTTTGALPSLGHICTRPCHPESTLSQSTKTRRFRY